MSWQPKFLDAHQGGAWAKPGIGPRGYPALVLDLTDCDTKSVSLPLNAVDALREACDNVIAEYGEQLQEVADDLRRLADDYPSVFDGQSNAAYRAEAQLGLLALRLENLSQR